MRMILIAILCFLSMWFCALAADEVENVFSYESLVEQISAPAKETETSSEKPSNSGLTMLMADSGKNLSEMNFTLYSAVADFGDAGIKVGEVVKFSAPSPGWTLKSLQIVGWSGFNKTSGLFPLDRNFLIEVRDEETNLLYKFADTQNFYFASTTGPVAYNMDIPSLPVTRDFYVIFYDRGSMFLGAEQSNVTNVTNNSYLVVNGQIMPAEIQMRTTNETVKVNWLIRAIGE